MKTTIQELVSAGLWEKWCIAHDIDQERAAIMNIFAEVHIYFDEIKKYLADDRP